MHSTLRYGIAAQLSFCLATFGASAPIGVVKGGGDFELAGTSVRGNGTVFSGDTIASSNFRADVSLSGGSELMLAPHSRSKIFSEKAVLEKGAGEVRVSRAYVVEAGAFRVSIDNGRALVGYMPETSKLHVRSNEGIAEVRNSQGVLIAQVRRGVTLLFQTQSGATGAVQYTGTLKSTSDGKFVLTDEATQKTVELRGDPAQLTKNVGKKVTVRGSEIPGAQAAGGATSAVSVTSVSVAAAAAGASAVSTGVVVAVVAAGATAAVFGGLAVAGAGPFGSSASQ